MIAENTSSQNNLPVKTFRDRSISVSIWENTHSHTESGDTKIHHSLDLRRGYRKDDAWEHTTSVNGNDALRVANLYRRAYDWILDQKCSQQTSSTQADKPQSER